MQNNAHTILTALYPGKTFRFSLYPDTMERFRELPFIEKSIPIEKITVHKDPQGLLQARKKDLRFVMDPPTGNFRLNGSKGEIISGIIQSGEFATTSIFIRNDPGDIVYGFGAAEGGPDKNNCKFRLLNLDTLFYSIPKSSYSSFPFYIMRRGKSYTGIFIASSFPMNVHVDSKGISPFGPGVNVSFEKGSGRIPINIFVIQGGLDEILNSYMQITGFPCKLPAWALGFHQSRWSYSSQNQIIELTKKFKKYDIPCDAIYLDIDYMDRYRNFTWNRKNFPSPERMNKILMENGFRAVNIVETAIPKDPKYFIYKEGHDSGMFCRNSAGEEYTGSLWGGKSVFPDFSSEKVRSWWSKKLQILFDSGASGFWNDMNDPVLKPGRRYDPLAENILHETESHNEIRNLYANFQAEASKKAFDIGRPDERPFILTRSGFPGIQKHAVIWTGDNHQSWKHLKENLHMIINLGVSGMPFCGADIGGFASGPGKWGLFVLHRNRELFARWIELGSLMPFFRAHSVKFSVRREVWSFGDETLKLCRKHIKRRYRLMHYIYNLMIDAHETGSPLVRPVFYEFPEVRDKEYADQFMLGSRLLAAPVLEKNMSKISFQLPAGNWYEFETGDILKGNAKYELQTQAGYYPLFIREGTILPVCKAEKNAEESLQKSLILEIYPSKTMSYTLRLDDGKSTNNKTMIVHFQGDRNDTGNIQFRIEIKEKNHNPEFKTFTIRLPLKFTTAITAGKKIDATKINLANEDRDFFMNSFEFQLKKQNIEFIYEK